MNYLNTYSSYYVVTNTNTPSFEDDGRIYLVTSYSQNSSTRKTTVLTEVYAQIKTVGSGYSYNYNFNVVIGGVTQNYTGSKTVSLGLNLYYIATYSREFTHNPDGSHPAIGYSGNGYLNIPMSGGGYAPRRYTSNHTFTPPSFPSVSTVTNNTSTSSRKDFGDTSATDVSFSISRYVDTYTHTLKYTVGGTTTTIDTGIATSKSYTFPLSLISSFPSTSEPTITVSCDTYNGATLVGTKTTTVYLKVPDSYVPTCSLSLSDDNSITSTWGIWVKSQSILRGVITASGVSGSTISSYLSTLESENRSGTPFTKTLQTSGTVTVTSTVTDTRGRTAQDSEEITVHDYTVPTLVSIAVKRCLVDGTLDEFGTYGKVVCEYSISSCDSNNAKSLVVNLGETVKTFTLTNYSGTVTATTAQLFSGLAIDTTYNLTFKLKDSFFDATTTDKTVSQVYSVLPSFVLESDHNGGDGKCFGRIATRAGLDSYLDATFFGELKKGVVDEETEYKVLDESDIVQTLTDDEDKVMSANAVKNMTNLVAETTLTNTANNVKLNDLDIVRDGGIYDFVITGKTSTARDVFLFINAINTSNSYYSRYINSYATSLSSTGVNSNNQIRFDIGYCCTKGTITFDSSNSKAFIFMENLSMDNSGNTFFRHITQYVIPNVSNITTINFSTNDVGITFGIGSGMKVWKR